MRAGSWTSQSECAPPGQQATYLPFLFLFCMLISKGLNIMVRIMLKLLQRKGQYLRGPLKSIITTVLNSPRKWTKTQRSTSAVHQGLVETFFFSILKGITKITSMQFTINCRNYINTAERIYSQGQKKGRANSYCQRKVLEYSNNPTALSQHSFTRAHTLL